MDSYTIDNRGRVARIYGYTQLLLATYACLACEVWEWISIDISNWVRKLKIWKDPNSLILDAF